MSTFIERLGWVLVHSLWQFTLLAVGAFVFQRAMRGASALARYGVLLAMLGIVVAAPFATWGLLPVEAPQPVISALEPSVLPKPVALPKIAPAPVTVEVVPLSAPVAPAPIVPVASAPPPKPRLPNWSERIHETVTPWLATIVWGWSLGVLAFAMRPLLGWFTVRRLRTHGVSPVPEAVQSALTATAQRLGITHAVRVLQSAVVQVPIVAGYFQPVILLPVSIVTGMPASQIEAILAHELAHIRRHDYLVNLIQTLIETIFFYHPGVWWLSHQIRCERENCCDDIAVGVIGDRVDYSRALLALEELRATQTPLAVGANGGSLVIRVRRLFHREPEPDTLSNGSVALGATLIVGVLTLAAIAAAGPNQLIDNETLETDSPPPTLIAKLSGGLEVELVGITRNTAPAKEGWRPNGTPLSAVSGWKVHLVTQEGETTHTITENDPRSDRDARDLLLQLRGLKGQRPSIFISTPSGSVRNGQWLPNDDPFEIRLPVGRSERFQVSSTPGGPLKKEVVERSWQPLPEDPQLTIGITVAPWGTPVKIRPDGVILNPTQPDDLYAETYKLVEVLKAVATNGSWITIRQPPTHVDPANRLHAYDFEFYAIDTEGGRHSTVWRQEFPNGKYDVWVSSHGGLHELPDGKTLSHYEYRVRPYRDWVTFSGLAMEPGKVTKAKVIRASYDPPQRGAEQKPMVAKLPDGLEIELVGITPNAAPTPEGWRGDGQPIVNAGDWPRGSTFSKDGDRFTMTTDAATKLTPDPLARDLLFECRGAASRPSWTVLRQSGLTEFQTLGTDAGLRKRLTLLRKDQAVQTTVEMAYTDSPWGPWQRIDAAGMPINTIETFAPDQKLYGEMKTVRLGASANKSDLGSPLELVLSEPAVSDDYYSGIFAIDVRFVDRNQKVWATYPRPGPLKDGRRTVTWTTGGPVPLESLAYAEFRLRPYRHFITFENVPLEKTAAGRVIVKHRSLPEPPRRTPDDRFVAHLPEGMDIELLRLVRNDLPDEQSWLPSGEVPLTVVDLPSRSHYKVQPDGNGYSSSSEGPGSDRAWDVVYDVRNSGPYAFVSVDVVGEGSVSSSQTLPAIGPRLVTLLPKAPESLTAFQLRVGTEPWGEWIQVGADGEILNPEAIRTAPDAPDRLVTQVRAGLDAENLDRTWFQWRAPQNHAQHYQMEVRAIDDDGQVTESNSSTHSVADRTHVGITKFFNLPLDRLARFEYRLRPYRHLVTFDQICTDPAKPTEVRVDVSPIVYLEVFPSPEAAVKPTRPLVAKLPGGLEVELVGVAKNFAPSKEGWKPDGSPLGEVPDWKATTVIARDGNTLNIGNSGTPLGDARDLLFEMRGLQSQPFCRLLDLKGQSGWDHLPLAEPYRNRLSLLPNEPVDAATFRMAITDAPWGPYQEVGLDSALLNKLELESPVKEHYNQIRVVRCGASPQKPEEAEMVLEIPARHGDKYDIEVQAIDPDGKVLTCLRGNGQNNGTIYTEQYVTWDHLPADKIARWEYRLRPYRHFITFENVSFEPGKKTEPKVSVESIAVAEPPKNYIAQVPGGIEVELLGTIRELKSRDRLSLAPDGSPLPNLKPYLQGSGDAFNDRRFGLKEFEDQILYQVRGGDSPTVGVRASVPFGLHAVETDTAEVPTRYLIGDALPKTPITFTAKVADEPWGEWIHVSPTGQILNPGATQQRHAAYYDKITIGHAGEHKENTSRSELQLNFPEGFFDSCPLHLRIVPKEGQKLGDEHSMHYQPDSFRQSFNLPPDQIERFEFRLRPYRHLVKFENVSLDPEKPTEPKVSVEPIPEFQIAGLDDERAAWDELDRLHVHEALNVRVGAYDNLKLAQKSGDQQSVEKFQKVLDVIPTKADFWQLPKEAWPLIHRLKSLEEVRFVACDLRGQGVHLQGLKNLRKFQTINSEVLPQELATLGMLTQLESIETEIKVGFNSNDGLAELVTTLPEVDRKRIQSDNIDKNILSMLLTDNALAKLSGLKQLKVLDLKFTYVSGTGIRNLAQHPNLERFSVDEWYLLTPESMQALGSLKKLRQFPPLPSGKPELLAPLAELTQLESLMIEGDDLTDEGIGHLLGMSSLKRLDIIRSQTTDEGLMQLAALPQLVRLDIRDVRQISETGLKQFQEKRPNCRVIRTEADMQALMAANDAPVAQPPTPEVQPSRVELIGLTYDKDSKTDAWQTNGQPMQVPEWVQSLPRLHNDDKGLTPLLFLYEIYGLRAKPSFHHNHRMAVVSGDKEPSEGRPYRMAVLFEDLKPGIYPDSWCEYPAVRATDEPWGPWRTITKEGQFVAAPDPNTLYPEGYELMTAHGIRPLTKLQNDPEPASDAVRAGLVLKYHQEYDSLYAMEIEAVPTSPEQPNVRLTGRRILRFQNEAKKRWDFETEWPVDPEKINHIRYRIRPYRHQYVFESVAFSPSQKPDKSTPCKAVYKKLEHDMPKPVALLIFPDLTEEERNRLGSELDRMQDAEVTRIWDRVEYFQEKQSPQVVAVYCKILISRFPDTVHSERAKKVLDQQAEIKAAQTKASLPGGMELELLGVTPYRGAVQDGWTPQGLKFEKAPEWAGGLKLESLPPGEMGDSANEAYRDFIVRARGFIPEQLALLPFSQKIESGDSTIGPMSVLTWNQQVQRLRIGIPGEWGLYRVLTVDAKVPPQAKAVEVPAEVSAPYRMVYDSIQPVIDEGQARGFAAFDQFPFGEVNLNQGQYKGQHTRVVWKGQPSNPDHKYTTMEAVLVDLEGKHHTTAETTNVQDGESQWDVDLFDVPFDQVSHVEYRLRPYQNVVTFNNVALHVGAECGPNVVVELPLAVIDQSAVPTTDLPGQPTDQPAKPESKEPPNRIEDR